MPCAGNQATQTSAPEGTHRAGSTRSEGGHNSPPRARRATGVTTSEGPGAAENCGTRPRCRASRRIPAHLPMILEPLSPEERLAYSRVLIELGELQRAEL